MRVVTSDDSVIEGPRLQSILRGLGYEVVAHAYNGEEGIRLCRLHRPDVAIFDVLMPRMTGDRAAKVVHAEGLAGRIVMATSQGQQAIKDFAASIGAALIIKPYSEGQFRKVLEAQGEPSL